ncbi:MAG: YfjP family GTPase [Actinomycetota bacterium]
MPGGAMLASVDARLAALAEALEAAENRLPTGEIGLGQQTLARAGRRRNLAPELTVAALAGATGSGKSSLFNLIVGRNVSEVGVIRPTTSEPLACTWGETPAEGLLEWLQIARRHRMDGRVPNLDGLILIDLPDHDSVEQSHRLEVDRLVQMVDMLVWVVDPEKYADAALHDRYLRPLAAYADVILVVLNKVDRLMEGQRRQCARDLRRLLREDGLDSVPLLVTSALTGEGIDELREEFARKVATKRAAAERLLADIELTTRFLGSACDPAVQAPPIAPPARARLVSELSDAAGLDLVAEAVRRSHRHRARLTTGWPPTRWLRRVRVDALTRLAPSGAHSIRTRSPLAPPAPVQQARVGQALQELALGAGARLPRPWPHRINAVLEANREELADRLDKGVAATYFGEQQHPRWWAVANMLQAFLTIASFTGALWIGLLLVLDALELPRETVARFLGVPVPVLLVGFGVVAGILLGIVCSQLAHAESLRRKERARSTLEAGIAGLAYELAVEPVQRELRAYNKLCAALQRARGA